MIPLQSSAPEVGPPAALFFVLVFVGGIVGALGSAVVRRLPNPVGKYRLLYAGVLVPLALLAYALLALLGFGTVLVGSVTPDVSGLLAAVLGDLVELLAAGVVWLVAYAPTVRGVREVRDIALPTGRAIGRMARYVVGLSVLVALVLAPLRVGSAGTPLLVVAVELAVLGVLFVVLSPWLLPLLRTTNRPTGEAAERIETLVDRAGLDVRDVLVLETDDEETAGAYVRGPPGYRRLFVTSTFVDRLDDATATALLAVQAGRVRSRVLPVRVGTVVASGLLLVASVTGAGPRWPTLGASLAVLVVGFWRSRRGVRAADDHAAERVGAPAVVEALERYAEFHAIEPRSRRLPNPLSVNVPLGDRIDRLDERAES